MTATALQAGTRSPARLGYAIPLALIAGAYANGYFKAAWDWLEAVTSASEFGLPVSLLDAIIVAVAWRLIAGSRLSCRQTGLGLAEILSAAAVMIPSSAVSWAAACAYSSFCAVQERGNARTGFMLLAGLAAAQLWISVCIKWFALTLGTADAALACGVLSLWTENCERHGNVFGFVPGHSIIVLYGCTAAYFLPKLLLVQAAAIAKARKVKLTRFWLAIGFAGTFGAAANAVRLALMAVSAEFYGAIHSAWGGSIFDLLMILAVYALSSRMVLS
jgi:hypothetical protein